MINHLKLFGLLGVILVSLMFVNSAVKADDSFYLEFQRIGHLDSKLEVHLVCDETDILLDTIQNTPLGWFTYSYNGSFSGSCEALTVKFVGTIYSSDLGQKLDYIVLTKNGSGNLLTNPNFDDGLVGWYNENNGWYWAVPPKEQAKLDAYGAGANATRGIPYELSQTVGEGTTPDPTPFPTATPDNSQIPRWCLEHPEAPRCAIYYGGG